MPNETSEVTRVAYLASSALIKLAVDEPESPDLEKGLEAWPERVTSKLATVEVLRAIRSREPRAEPVALRVLENAALIEIDDRILARAAAVKPAGLRALDAIHVASALSLGLELGVFITYDVRQLRAARAVGLTVVTPGAGDASG